MPKLAVVIASTRPGRVGWPVGQWFLDRARAHGKFEVELIDLKELNLPHLDEPKHPRLQQYEHAHTKAWSKTVSQTDTFVFVTPEYNYGMPPALLNALKVVGKDMTKIKVVVNGLGAAGTACCKMLLAAGVTHLVGCDRKGAVLKVTDANLEAARKDLRALIAYDAPFATLHDELHGADVFIGVSVGKLLRRLGAAEATAVAA